MTNGFVFISYKSDDRDLIRPYLQLLDDNGIRYWWDQEIARDWSQEIDTKLEECSVVLGFMTETSLQSDAVFAEFDTGKSMDKLFPVKLDPARPHYRFRTVIGSLSWVDLSVDSTERIEEEKQKLVNRLRELLGMEAGPAHADPGLGDGDLAQWFSRKDRQSHLAYIIALCVFEGRSHDFIQDCAALLERECADNGLDAILGFNSSLVTRQAKLKSIGAKVEKYRSRITGSAFDSVVFEDGRFAEAAFLYIWDELDQLKSPITRWFNRLLEVRPGDCVEDIAFTLSLIGRRNFQSIYRLILRPWLAQAWTWRFLCADITLSLLLDDPGIKAFTSSELLRVGIDGMETAPIDASPTEGETTAEAAREAAEFSQQLSRRAAIALVTGYAGMRMPDLSVALFKRIDGEFTAETVSRLQTTLADIDRGIDHLLLRARTDAYAQALPAIFARGIHDWMIEERESRQTVLPEYIFLRLLVKLTSDQKEASPIRGVALWDVLATGDEVEIRLVETFGKTIAAALECRNVFIRDQYVSWMKDWKAQIKERRHTGNDSVRHEGDMRLFRELFDAAKRHASGSDDVERINWHTKLS